MTHLYLVERQFEDTDYDQFDSMVIEADDPAHAVELAKTRAYVDQGSSKRVEKQRMKDDPEKWSRSDVTEITLHGKGWIVHSSFNRG